MTAAFFVILASACFSTGDFLGGFASKRMPLLLVIVANQIAGLATILLAASLLSGFAPSLWR